MKLSHTLLPACALLLSLGGPVFAGTTIGGVSLDTIRPDTSTYEQRVAAAQPYVKEVAELFNYKELITQMWQPVARIAAKKGHPLNAVQKRQLDALYQKTLTAPLKSIMASQDKLLAKTFTLQEIKATSAFHTTPVGKQILTKMPEVMKSIQPQTMALLREVMPKMLPQIKKIAEENS